VESKLSPLGTSATEWPTLPAPGDYDDGEFGGIKIGRGNRSTQRKPAPVPLCPPQIPLGQTRSRTRAAAVGSQLLTAWAMARPSLHCNLSWSSATHRTLYVTQIAVMIGAKRCCSWTNFRKQEDCTPTLLRKGCTCFPLQLKTTSFQKENTVSSEDETKTNRWLHKWDAVHWFRIECGNVSHCNGNWDTERYPSMMSLNFLFYLCRKLRLKWVQIRGQ
jgi:hypothetical protein